MDKSILLKYARQNTPRYTSYPTAPHFHDAIGSDQFSSWLTQLDPGVPGSLYLHIPYCREMCWYCGCSTRATTRTEPIDAYCDLLLREIDLVREQVNMRLPIAHVHFGGGSPTILSADQLGKIMTRLREVFHILPNAEIAIEIDPRLFTQTMAVDLSRLGFNRASLGVQTFDQGVQAKINRMQCAQTVDDCVEELRAHGIDQISFDLLYGLPGQSVQSCLNTVDTALALRPDRLSVFGYAHVPHMRKHQNLIKREDLPDGDERIEQALALADAITSEGYVPIGIDHYALKTDDMAEQVETGLLRRNFQGYTTDQASYLIGLGASSISRLPQGYAQTNANVAEWSRSVEAGELAITRGFELSRDDRLRAEIIERLMCDLRVDYNAVAADFATRMEGPDLSDLIEDGIIVQSGSQIVIREDYRLLARVVACRFDTRFSTEGARHSVSV